MVVRWMWGGGEEGGMEEERIIFIVLSLVDWVNSSGIKLTWWI